MSRFPAEFIQAIPKTDLHLHLDGSLRIGTLIDLAQEAGVALPAQDEKGLRERVFKDKYQNLEEYLQGFALTTAVMQSENALFRVSYELMMDNAAEGVRYIEVRFAPQLLMSNSLSFHQVMGAVDLGLRQACDELNATRNPDEPAYNYGIIACAMRFFTGDFSPWYRDFSRAHAFSTPTEIIRAASLELAKGVIRLRAETPIQIVGFDIAGAENGFPAIEHAESYALIQKGMLGKTVQAGEAFGPKSILQAVAKLRTDRIGHGLRLFDEDMIEPQKVADRTAYIESLVNYIADRRIAIEVCLTSNMQTSPEIGELPKHALRKMLEHNLAVTLCTDNRLVSNTSVCQEYALALDNFEINAKCLRNIVLCGFKRSFYYRPYREKRALVSSVGNYYDTLFQKFAITD